jgi:tetratricopeptide (TPR) repeat protein
MTSKIKTMWWMYGVTVAALVVTSFLPDQRLWAINWYAYFAPVALAIMIVAAIIAALVIGRVPGLRDVEPDPEYRSSDIGYRVASIVILLVLPVLFYLFRAQTHFLGDGYQLITSLQAGVNHKPWEAATFLIQKWILSTLGGEGEPAAEQALQVTSYLSGFLFALVTVFVSARLFSDFSRRLLYFCGVMTGGYALLFFGYIESYPLFVLAVGAFYQAGLLITAGKLSRWFVLPLVGLAAFCHIFTVALIPGTLYLLLRDTTPGYKIVSASRRVKATVLAVFVLAGGAVFAHYYAHSYFFRFTIVPLFSDRYTVEGYTLFSLKHLLDYFNQFVQLFPGLAVALVVLWPMLRRNPWSRPAVVFTTLVLLPSMALTFIFNPGLGMPRDWDLFSFAGLPLVCGSFFLLLDEGRRTIPGMRAAALAVVLGGLILVPRVVTQVIPEKGIAVFDRLSELDLIKNSRGRFIVRQYLTNHGQADEATTRRVHDNEVLPQTQWVETARSQINGGNVEGGVALLWKTLAFDPTSYSAWANLGVAYAFKGMNDSARYYFEIADARMPYNADIKRNLGGVYYTLEDFARAEEFWLEAAEIAPDLWDLKPRLVMLYERLGREADLAAILESPKLDAKSRIILLTQSADLSLQMHQDAVGAALLRRALQAGAESNVICDFQRRYPKLHLIDCSVAESPVSVQGNRSNGS